MWLAGTVLERKDLKVILMSTKVWKKPLSAIYYVTDRQHDDSRLLSPTLKEGALYFSDINVYITKMCVRCISNHRASTLVSWEEPDLCRIPRKDIGSTRQEIVKSFYENTMESPFRARSHLRFRKRNEEKKFQYNWNLGEWMKV